MRRKFSILLTALFLSIGLCSCGTPLYEMTEDESDLIATYCASTVAKFNRFQDDGLVFVVNKTTAEQQEALGRSTPTVDETVLEEEDEVEALDGTDAESSESDIPDQETDNVEIDASVGEILGYPELEVFCDTMYVVDEYQEGNYILLTPNNGNNYLVLEVSIKNPTETPIECNFAEKSPSFVIELSDGTRIESEGTILLDDFSTFDEKVNAHGQAYAVALAQAPAGKLTDISDVRVYLQAGGTSTELPLVEP